MKKILMIAVSLVMSGMVNASTESGYYLYWMVDVPEDNFFAYAKVSANGNLLMNEVNTEGGATQAPVVEVSNESTEHKGFGTKTEGVYAFDVTPYLTGSTFVFELLDQEGKTISFKTMSSASLSDFFGTTMSQISAPYTVKSVTQFIPEPTSGLLMLIGLAGLALKRKRT